MELDCRRRLLQSTTVAAVRCILGKRAAIDYVHAMAEVEPKRSFVGAKEEVPNEPFYYVAH
jgi:hypothetical protein